VERQLLTENRVFGCPFRKKLLSHKDLIWTAQKSDLIELLYALDASGCFNSGKVSLNQIAIYLEEVFQTDLTNYSQNFYEMRIRLDQTPFIDKLRKELKNRMENPQKQYSKS
jgi:hypothetical protein